VFGCDLLVSYCVVVGVMMNCPPDNITRHSTGLVHRVNQSELLVVRAVGNRGDGDEEGQRHCLLAAAEF
jgi:hypothetical protein